MKDTVRRNSNTFTLFFVAALGAASSACQSGGVGDPCIPEDEYVNTFAGYQPTEVNVESQSFQCETRVCLVANFRGRTSCPYGNKNQGQTCFLPGTKSDQTITQNVVSAQVDPWIVSRKPDQAVYCSCRCDGEDQAARYCDCPSGFICQKLITSVGGKQAQLAGSYCIKEGTQVPNPAILKDAIGCQPGGCGPEHPDEL